MHQTTSWSTIAAKLPTEKQGREAKGEGKGNGEGEKGGQYFRDPPLLSKQFQLLL